MKNNQILQAAALVAFTLASGAVSASAQITIPTVTVGNIGNSADTTGFGAVRLRVSDRQIRGDEHAVCGVSERGGFENKPVIYVSFWDATRFANWLNNGQGSASTETGSYTLGSVTNPVNSSVTRNVGANWVVASENEWYKAAYYDPNKGGPGVGGYWLHATQSDTLGQNNPFTDANGANYYDGDYANGGFSGPGTTDVGAYANADSYYGTSDQGGNVFEPKSGDRNVSKIPEVIV
jgi:formylglycine-generating enzyme required for sulfatase activity